jgi:hypothetical protein
VRHANLVDDHPSFAEPDEQLRREECTVRVHADTAERVTPKEFCGTVNVANAEAEPDSISRAIDSGIHVTQWWIGSLQAKPDDNRRSRCLSTFNEARKIGDAELSVTIGIGEIVVARRRKARTKRSAVTPTLVVANQAHDTAMLLNQALGDAASVVTRAIVNENDLIGRREGGEGRERLGDQPLKVLLLVVAREEK